jgi:group I intron endonuclease
VTSGIYEIVNLSDGRRYIGSAVNIRARWKGHRSILYQGKHHNPFFQRAWDKYGPEAFKFSVIGLCAPGNLLFFEQACLDTWKPEYNISPTAGSTRGVFPTKATRKKLARARAGRMPALGMRHTLESRAAISAAATGKKHSAEWCANISRSLRGKPKSRAHCLNLSRSHDGRVHRRGENGRFA